MNTAISPCSSLLGTLPLIGLLKYSSLAELELLQQSGSMDKLDVNSEGNKTSFFSPEIPESWLSKHSPGYFKSRFCEKKQIG